ncbi:hypothetical protein Q9292_09905 [Methylophilus sp. VKM B-3414]|uniref:hypothetical protein n=1 Tax=Methylophilus sp. VKM B-3414 TaxID=3076121 RepID=UPI0028C6A078|nr:hypothetical protein [Methylophilus sp. VKM B-3414]MDT7849925.1 hypothetical protein [Methylophilus sp. VKM B-3414]
MTVIVKNAGKFEGVHYAENQIVTSTADIESRMINDGFAKFYQPVKGLDGQNAWRVIGQESSMPKAAGTWRLLGSKNTRVMTHRLNKVLFSHSFQFGVGESMKAVNAGTTNGNGLVHASLIHNGVAYPTYVAKLVGVDDNGNAIMEKVNLRDATADYGSACYLIAELPYFLEPGDSYVESVMCYQNAHNDSGAGATLAGQFMNYTNKTRGKDKFYRHNSTDPVVIEAWKTWADSADLDAVPTGAVTVTINGVVTADQPIGWKAHSVIGWVDASTVSVFSAGDSREHGQDNGATSTTDPGLDIYGNNGEASHIFRNICNVGIQTEKAGDITDASKFKRSEFSVFCNVGLFGYGINDLNQAGSAITKENTSVSTYKQLVDAIKSYVKPFNVWLCKTISPSVTSSNYLIDIAGQSPQVATAIRRINGAIRRGLVGNDGYVEVHNAVAPSPDACIYKVLPQSRMVNTGTLTLSSVAATTDDAAYILATASSNIFNRDDNFLKGVIKGIATGSAIPATDLKFLMEYISAAQVKVWLRGTKDNPVPYPTSWINGSLPLVVTLSANPLYIGADHYCDSSNTGYIHLSPEGEEQVTIANRQLDLPRI